MLKRCLHSVVLLLGLAFVLFSCTKEDLQGGTTGGESDGDGTGTGGNYFSLAMKIPLPKGYSATRDPGATAESRAEVMVEEIRVVLYGIENTVKRGWDLDIKLDFDGNNPVASGEDLKAWEIRGESIFIQTKAKSIHSGRYKMLIVVNPNDRIKAITAERSPISLIQDGTFDTTEENSLYQIADGVPGIDNGQPVYFLMLNHQGLIALEEADFYENFALAEQNPVSAQVERAVAKVNVSYNIADATVYTDGVYTYFTNPPTHHYDIDWIPNPGPYGRFVMMLDETLRVQISSDYTLKPNFGYIYWPVEDYDIPDYATPYPVTATDKMWDRLTKALVESTKTRALPPGEDDDYFYHTSGLGLVRPFVRYMTATDIMWHVDVVNKKGYFLRHMADKANGRGMEQYGDTDRRNFYAQDPNFSVAGSDPTNDFANLSSFIYTDGKGFSPRRLAPPSYSDFEAVDAKSFLSPLDLSSYWSWTSSDDAPIYIPENTMEKEAQQEDMATRVIFEITLRRDKNSSSTAAKNNNLPAGPFFVYKGGTQQRGREMFNNEYYENGQAKYFYIIWPEHVAAYATGLLTEERYIDSKFAGILAEIERFKEENPTFDFTATGINSNAAARSDNLIFYPGGKLYYAVPIEHFTRTEAGGAGEYGRFGVVRNNWYNLSLQTITTIGEFVIPARSSDLIENPATRSSNSWQPPLSVSQQVR